MNVSMPFWDVCIKLEYMKHTHVPRLLLRNYRLDIVRSLHFGVNNDKSTDGHLSFTKKPKNGSFKT